MRERGEAGFLSRTQPFWLEHFVAPKEVWPSVSPTGGHDTNALIQHQWKNGYHAMEHALVSYIAAQTLAGRPVRLYYAPSAAKAPLGAYYFGGTVIRARVEARKGGKVLAVDLHLAAPADSVDPVPSLAQPQPPGIPVALTADNAAALLGRWEGAWSADEVGGDGPVVIQFDAVEQGRVRGWWTAQGTPDDAHSHDVPFGGPARFDDGRMIVGLPGSPLSVTYTLRRDGDTQRLEGLDRAREFAVRLRVSREAP